LGKKLGTQINKYMRKKKGINGYNPCIKYWNWEQTMVNDAMKRLIAMTPNSQSMTTNAMKHLVAMKSIQAI